MKKGTSKYSDYTILDMAFRYIQNTESTRTIEAELGIPKSTVQILFRKRLQYISKPLYDRVSTKMEQQGKQRKRI